MAAAVLGTRGTVLSRSTAAACVLLLPVFRTGRPAGSHAGSDGRQSSVLGSPHCGDPMSVSKENVPPPLLEATTLKMYKELRSGCE